LLLYFAFKTAGLGQHSVGTWVNNALAITTGQKRMLEAPDKLIQGSIGITGQVNAVMVDVY